MGGSDSRCCIDGEDKFEKKTAVHVTALESPLKVTRLIEADPRSPSNAIHRTPIEVEATPVHQPKPLMRVQPMVDNNYQPRKVVDNVDNRLSGQDVEAAVLIDPRSRGPNGARTPIVFDSKQEVCGMMIDPRSPTAGIVRTPLLIKERPESFCKDENKRETISSKDSAIFETPKKFSDEDVTMLDPRSPSQGIDRTPITNAENQVHRTECVAARNLPDPRSPTTEISRTPLGAMIAGHRELRRTVLMTNALMASPLVKKMSSFDTTAQDMGDELEFLDAQQWGDQNCADMSAELHCNVDSIDSCSSSMIASIGSDVDGLSLNDSIGDEQASMHSFNTIDTVEVELMDQYLKGESLDDDIGMDQSGKSLESDVDGTINAENSFVACDHMTEGNIPDHTNMESATADVILSLEVENNEDDPSKKEVTVLGTNEITKSVSTEAEQPADTVFENAQSCRDLLNAISNVTLERMDENESTTIDLTSCPTDALYDNSDKEEDTSTRPSTPEFQHASLDVYHCIASYDTPESFEPEVEDCGNNNANFSDTICDSATVLQADERELEVALSDKDYDSTEKDEVARNLVTHVKTMQEEISDVTTLMDKSSQTDVEPTSNVQQCGTNFVEKEQDGRKAETLVQTTLEIQSCNASDAAENSACGVFEAEVETSLVDSPFVDKSIKLTDSTMNKSKKKPPRRLRTPKAMATKSRSVSSSLTSPTRSFGSVSTRIPRYTSLSENSFIQKKENCNSARKTYSLKKSDEKLDTANVRSPLASRTNERNISQTAKASSSPARSNTLTRLPRYKTGNRSLSASQVMKPAQSTEHQRNSQKPIMKGKEN